MKAVIEIDVSNKDMEELKSKNFDIKSPFLVNASLDYGDKVVYGSGKVVDIIE